MTETMPISPFQRLLITAEYVETFTFAECVVEAWAFLDDDLRARAAAICGARIPSVTA
jgi:hypothetical protein